MLPMGLALMPEPSDQEQVQFGAAEIFRLWGDDGHQFARKLQQAPSRYRVAAMLSTQELDVTCFTELEQKGVLVVEVPEALRDASNEHIAAYLTTQLNEGRQETLHRMAAMGTSDRSGQDEDDQDVAMSEEAEAEFLEFVNDPANQLGGHF